VTALDIGSAIITAETGKYTATCTVTVRDTGGYIIVDSDRAVTFINLMQETIELGGFAVKSYSVDGGAKWKKFSKTFDDRLLGKLLNNKNGLALQLSSSDDFDKTSKKPADNTVVKFSEIKSRKTLPKFDINYKNEGYWYLSKNKSDDNLTEVILVAQLSAPGAKTAGAFGGFNNAEAVILPVTSTVKNINFIKVSPNDDNGYTAGSKVKKITVKNELKPPKLAVKNNAIKTKKGMAYTIEGDPAVKLTGTGTPTLENPGIYTFWIAATSKKPASAKQTPALEIKPPTP